MQWTVQYWDVFFESSGRSIIFKHLPEPYLQSNRWLSTVFQNWTWCLGTWFVLSILWVSWTTMRLCWVTARDLGFLNWFKTNPQNRWKISNKSINPLIHRWNQNPRTIPNLHHLCSIFVIQSNDGLLLWLKKSTEIKPEHKKNSSSPYFVEANPNIFIFLTAHFFRYFYSRVQWLHIINCWTSTNFTHQHHK